jgi:hypothetical protein
MSVQTTETAILLDGAAFPIKAILQAADVAALKAVTGMGNAEVRLVPAMGLYYYDSSSAGTADDRYIIDPTVGSGQWLLVGKEALSIQRVATAAALRALTGMLDGDARIVDGIGLFYFDDDATDSDDGVSIIEPSAGAGAWLRVGWDDLRFKFTWNPGNLVDGAGETSVDLTCTGAELGDFVQVSAPYDTQGLLVYGWVKAADTVAVRIQNETGGAVDLASGDWELRISKKTISSAVP